MFHKYRQLSHLQTWAANKTMASRCAYNGEPLEHTHWLTGDQAGSRQQYSIRIRITTRYGGIGVTLA